MTEETPEPVASDPVESAAMSEMPEPREPTTTVPTTGVPAVDEVLAEVESLARRPVAEHVAVFEDAHARLRQALDSEATPHAG